MGKLKKFIYPILLVCFVIGLLVHFNYIHIPHINPKTYNPNKLTLRVVAEETSATGLYIYSGKMVYGYPIFKQVDGVCLMEFANGYWTIYNPNISKAFYICKSSSKKPPYKNWKRLDTDTKLCFVESEVE